MTTATESKLPGHDLYEKLRKAIQAGSRSQIDKILESLVKACQKRVVAGEKYKLDDDQMNFWFKDVLRLLFDWENALSRDLALKAAEAVLPHLEQTLYLDSPAWPALKTQISNVYSDLLEKARGRNDPEWHRKWSVMVRILDKEICQGAQIINVFLAIVESGFRSSELLVREQSFDCWKLLVEIFAKYNQIHIQKRIKLICIPLKSSKSKTEVIAKKKFEIWWFVINKLQSQLDTFAENVFEPFIYFCFGPSFKTPLCYYFDESYQEFGAPGKIYNSIKQLSAIALIHMLGPAGKITESLLDASTLNGLINLNGPAANAETIISAKLFTLKAKLIINSCTECTVLFSQMKDKNYLELNRCLWGNLLAKIEQEKIIPRPELLGWIRENLAALISLSTQLDDEAIRALIYDTVRMVSQSNLLAVTIGHDSPEQLVNNFKAFMTLLFTPELSYPEDISSDILSHVFDLRRYASQRGGYWDMLQKTVQYLADLDTSMFTDPKSAPAIRRMVTQIYCSMAAHLKKQIVAQRDQFEYSQHIAFNFLLYPMEYDSFLEVNEVRAVWQEVYGTIVAGSRSTRYACAFSEMIKAMTVAKYNANLGVMLEFFRAVLESVPSDFELGHPPVKTLELLKDLVRKALVFQSSLVEVGKTIGSFRVLIEKMTIKGLMTVIMPVRNVFSELIAGENSRLMEEIKITLKSLVDRFSVAKFVTELKGQPKEVKWNCKMLISQLLGLPAEMQKNWKLVELKRLVDICEGKDPGKSPKAKKDEFVVIDKVWKFTPDKLTEHQRDRMREKRDDIPALYNDMSQSQDSFVIKPWTPNKIMIPADSRNDHEAIVLVASGDSSSLTNGTTEASMPKEQGAATAEKTKLDKENNNGNVQTSDKIREPQGNSTGSAAAAAANAAKKAADKKTKVERELVQLRIDTVEGKNLLTNRMSRTRRSESLEPTVPSRRKSADPKKHALSASKGENKRGRKPADKTNDKKANIEEEKETGSPAKKKADDKPKSAAERSSPRKSLNFDNVVDKEPATAVEAPNPRSPTKTKTNNESIDEVIESSQATSQSLLARKFTPRKLKDEAKEPAPTAVIPETPPSDKSAEGDLTKQSRKSPRKTEISSPSPSKNTRSAAASSDKKIAEMDTEPNTHLADTVPNTEPAEEKVETKPISPAKSPKKAKRSVSPPPAPEPMDTEPALENDQPIEASPKKSPTPQKDPLASPNLSPVRNLDEDMEPLAKHLNRSFVSSPEGADQQERDADLLNSTLNISPISEKALPCTPSASDLTKEPPTSGSGEKRASSRIMDREKTSVAPSPIARRTRNSPPGLPAQVANLKARTPQAVPRSPSTSKIELRGRGAQLINLIRSQRNESSPKPSSGPSPQNSSTPKVAPPAPSASTPGDRSMMLRKLATTAPLHSPEQSKPAQAEKEQEKDYLIFSKVLPSPQASPAASILKRKLNHDDSGDDIESPANKRKRVSFHDPPVSVTKEYIRQEEECRSPSITRCLQMAGMSPADKSKFLLRRKSKADSMSELAKFTRGSILPGGELPVKDDDDEISSSPESLEEALAKNTTADMSALQVTTEVEDVEVQTESRPEPIDKSLKTESSPVEPPELPKRTSPRKISPKTATEEHPAKKSASPVASAPVAAAIPEKPDTSIRFKTEDDILSHVISSYPLDSIMERYLAAGKTLEQSKSGRLLARELSTLMTKDSKMRYAVLDELSERHSVEFLNHAVQENSSSMVCQRLSMVTMTDYIFEKLKKLPAEGGSKEEQDERLKILQAMFDNLLLMHEHIGGEDFLLMRERFVKTMVHSKSKVEVIELLEEYFTNSGKTKTDAASSSTTTST